ncbi:SELO protein, partial [Polypterus senegalus]
MAAVLRSACRCVFRPALHRRLEMQGMCTAAGSSVLDKLSFDNVALRRLPLDTSDEQGSRIVHGACFSRVRLQPVLGPRLVALSGHALSMLGLDADAVRQDLLAPEYLSGSRLLPGSEPAAHCYCGHQFGQFAGQLGDGAVCYLGEVLAPSTEGVGVPNPTGRWEIQLKGSGLTPYSRHADGRKVLRSSVREFLASEALFHLGIPTTRAGSCVTSDSRVLRDVYYDGQVSNERCTVVLRIAPSFIRFGSFEIFKAEDEMTGRQGPSAGLDDLRTQLLDYVIDTFYPELQQAHPDDRVQRNSAFFREVVQRTARLVALWQCMGFCHGVLNTDNMSILGLTIDYGPYGFMDRFDPDFICNASDTGGRYSYRAQPSVCRWNLLKLAEALVPDLPLEASRAVLDEFDAEFDDCYLTIMRKKLGLLRQQVPEDKMLVTQLLETMHNTGSDFTNTFRLLSGISHSYLGDTEEDVLQNIVNQCASLEELKVAHRPRMEPRELSMMLTLAQANPVLFQFLNSRKPVMQELERVERYRELSQQSESDYLDKQRALWVKWLDKYRNRLSMEVEGATDIEALATERLNIMKSSNPRVVLRNYIAQNAIDAAERGDYSEVNRVLRVLENPFSDEVNILDDIYSTDRTVDESAEQMASEGTAEEGSPSRAFVPYDSKPPSWAVELCVT